MNRLTDEQKVKILSYRPYMSWGRLSEELQISTSTIRSFHEKWLKTKKFSAIKQKGRPKAITERILNRITTFLSSNPRTTLRMIKARFGLACCHKTISKYLHSRSYKNFRMKVKPKLTQVHRTARLRFERKYSRFSLANWRRVLFSDECSVELFKTYPERIWRKPGTAFKEGFYLPQKTVFTKKYIKIWSCFGAKGTGPIVFIDGSMNGRKYRDILSQHLNSNGRALANHRFIFQDDNDTVHRCRLLSEWHKNNRTEQMEWPWNSSDLK
jgi:hypothetical protein